MHHNRVTLKQLPSKLCSTVASGNGLHVKCCGVRTLKWGGVRCSKMHQSSSWFCVMSSLVTCHRRASHCYPLCSAVFALFAQ